jgi:prophage regulatory protein
MADDPTKTMILLKREVTKLTRLHDITLKRMEDKNLFPPRIRLGQRKVGWIEAEVAAWLSDRMAERFEARPVD